MKISHEHKFIFIHTPKTGGSSIASALSPFCHHPEGLPFNRGLSYFGANANWYGPLRWRYGRKHATARQVERMFPSTMLDQYFKFAFVRNPWDLLVSYYNFIASNPNHHRNRTVGQLSSFDEYIRYEIARSKVDQSRFVIGSSQKQLVDYVGRFENIRNHFDQICRAIGISASLGHENRSSRVAYQEYYSRETAALVATHWADDIERFGYTFEGDL